MRVPSGWGDDLLHQDQVGKDREAGHPLNSPSQDVNMKWGHVSGEPG